VATRSRECASRVEVAFGQSNTTDDTKHINSLALESMYSIIIVDSGGYVCR
jgi:hypothetical protein